MANTHGGGGNGSNDAYRWERHDGGGGNNVAGSNGSAGQTPL
jgi:hypothetical protein